LAINENPRLEVLLAKVRQRFEKFTVNKNMAVVVLQKETDAGNYATAIAVARLALQKFPDDELLYTAYGRALLEALQLDEAELALRTALQLNPKNVEARKLIEEIRATAEAQTSEEMAEWISIAKDKVGDFIVTFLALFAAFLTSSLLSPVALRLKLVRARKAFELGNYDDFTDLIEGLLDEENFVPLRANFRFMLAQKTYPEAQNILNKYVNTLERLPTLLRILKRENEKLHDTE
jgi:tetratricopeptide (TPR) repeat protein